MKRLSSEAGFTITELIVVIAISGLLMAAAATGFSAFFTKFNEMNKVMELQRDAFNCMQTIKNGVPIGSGVNLKFQGIATADSAKFTNTMGLTSSDITLYPPASDYTHQNDFVRIFLSNGYVRATYLNGSVQPPAPLYLFPKQSRRNDIYVTKLIFSQANTEGNFTRVVKVDLEARVKMKENVYRTVAYSSRMCLSMK